MNCTYCGKPITTLGVTENGNTFCNNLCRYTWDAGIANGTIRKGNEIRESEELFLDNLDFTIEHPLLEKQKLLLRCSYWRGPLLFLNNKRLTPSRSHFLKATTSYEIPHSEGKLVVVRLKRRLFDAIPSIKINNQPIMVARPLSVWEQILLAFPLLLLFLSGLPGLLIGGVAAFVNSILIRKINLKVIKYPTVVFNIIIVAFFCYKVISPITLISPELPFKLAQKFSVASNNPRVTLLTSHPWKTVKIIRPGNVEITDPKDQFIGTKHYFIGLGNYVLILKDGTIIQTPWSVDQDAKVITLKDDDSEERADVLKLTKDTLIFFSQGATFYNIAQ